MKEELNVYEVTGLDGAWFRYGQYPNLGAQRNEVDWKASDILTRMHERTGSVVDFVRDLPANFTSFTRKYLFQSPNGQPVRLSFHLRDLSGCILGRISVDETVAAVLLLIPAHRASIPLERWLGLLRRVLPAAISHKFLPKIREIVANSRGHLALCYMPQTVSRADSLSFRADQYFWIQGGIRWAKKRDAASRQRPAKLVQ